MQSRSVRVVLGSDFCCEHTHILPPPASHSVRGGDSSRDSCRPWQLDFMRQSRQGEGGAGGEKEEARLGDSADLISGVPSSHSSHSDDKPRLHHCGAVVCASLHAKHAARGRRTAAIPAEVYRQTRQTCRGRQSLTDAEGDVDQGPCVCPFARTPRSHAHLVQE